MTRGTLLSTAVVMAALAAPVDAKEYPGTGVVGFAGYTGCIELRNERTRVVLGPHCGGRLLSYSLDGKESIFRDPKQDGWTYTPGQPTVDPCGGRLDIGPETVIPRHPELWLGPWRAEATGPRAARMTSVPDAPTGVQLVRDFRLDEAGSRLWVTQTMRSVSKQTRHWCHWSRTLAVPGGIFMLRLNPESRFPKGYLLYGPGPVMNYSPADEPNIRRRGDFLEVRAVPSRPKFGIDSMAGWMAYAMPNDTLFVKRFPVYPERVYNEMAAYTVSLYYVPEFTELEPIGPRETLPPRGTASYTEEWELVPFPFPKEGQEINLNAVEKLAKGK